MKNRPLLSIWLSFLAYLILASCIVYGTIKIEQEFHAAHNERCAIVRVQLDVAIVEIAQLNTTDSAQAAQAERALADARRKVDKDC